MRALLRRFQTMRTKYLKCFLVLAEEQHYHRAAERLNVAQPLLSLAIKRLEAELGLQLFIRTQRSTQITEAGRRLVPDARRVLDTYEIGRATCRERVWPYVEISVVAGSLKKKKKR